MFDIGIWELAVIGLLALLVLGPKRLPEVARTLGRWVGRMRRFVASVKEDFDQELRSEELGDLRKLQQELSETRQLIERSSSQALANLEREVESTHPPARADPPAQRTASPRPSRTPKRKKPVASAQPAKKSAPRKKHGGARRAR